MQPGACVRATIPAPLSRPAERGAGTTRSSDEGSKSKGVSQMRTTTTSLPRPGAAVLIAALLCLFLPSTQYGQVIVGDVTSASSAATAFRGGATAVSGLALGSSLSIVNSG